MEYILLNGALVILGALLSTPLKKIMNQSMIHSVLVIANLSIVIIGIQGAIQTRNPLLLLLSGVIGGIIGTLLTIEKGFEKFGMLVQKQIKHPDNDFIHGL